MGKKRKRKKKPALTPEQERMARFREKCRRMTLMDMWKSMGVIRRRVYGQQMAYERKTALEAHQDEHSPFKR